MHTTALSEVQYFFPS